MKNQRIKNADWKFAEGVSTEAKWYKQVLCKYFFERDVFQKQTDILRIF